MSLSTGPGVFTPPKVSLDPLALDVTIVVAGADDWDIPYHKAAAAMIATVMTAILCCMSARGILFEPICLNGNLVLVQSTAREGALPFPRDRKRDQIHDAQARFEIFQELLEVAVCAMRGKAKREGVVILLLRPDRGRRGTRGTRGTRGATTPPIGDVDVFERHPMLCGQAIEVEYETDVVNMIRQKLLDAIDVVGIECIVSREERLLELLELCRLFQCLVILCDLHLLCADRIIGRLGVEEKYRPRQGQKKGGKVGGGQEVGGRGSSPVPIKGDAGICSGTVSSGAADCWTPLIICT